MTSVRGDRTVYRETDVEREYDQPRSSYTTIKRYKVPESITRSVYDNNNDDTTTKEKVIIRRTERRDSSPSPARSTRTHKSHRHHHHDHDDYNTEYKVTEKFTERERSRAPSSHTHTHRDDVDIRVTRTERERDPSPRRDIRYRVVQRDYSPERPRSEYRVVERDTEVIRAPSPPPAERTETREWRFERERSFSPPRERERPYDIERYSKSTEYFQPQQPQPIIIRESAPAAPIIIREERREPQKIIIRREVQEPQYEFIEKKEVVEETKEETKSLVKREEPPPPAPIPVPETKPEEDYFYERRVVERRRRSDSYDRKTEIRPKDSASQYSSDDSYEYVRRETRTDGGEDRHHRRHLAEGAIAGIGAAEILRHHRKSQGERVGGRGSNALAGAALGAVGTEAISKVRSMRSLRRTSRSRSRSDDGEPRRRHRRHRSRSRSRSKSLSRKQQLGLVAGLAGAAALAGYALKNRGNKETIIVNDRPRRSRSRRRRHSADEFVDDEERQHRDPGHRNRRIAQAGLASAAAAGIWDHHRSKSRGGRNRSKSRLRTGVPIAAAGLGGAALAGLYEKNQANKQAKRDAIIEDEVGRGRHRSRSRSRSAPAPYGDDRRRSVDGRPGLIAYGHDPIYSDSRQAHYNDEEPGRYRRRGGSGSSSPDNRRRSRSRRRNLAEAGAAAGVAAVAAHEIGKRRERSRASRERRRQDDDYYDERRHDDAYAPPPMGNSYPPYQNNDPYAQQAYPGSHYFPPPPNGENAGYVEPQPAYAHAQYNPADYAGQNAAQAPYDQHQAYGGYSEPYPGESHHNYAQNAQYGDEGRRGRDPENVSAPTPVNDEAPTPRESQESDGLRTPRPRSTSRVRFDLESNIAHSPDASRRKDDAKRDDPRDERRNSDTETNGDGKHRRRHRRHHRDKGKERERDSRRDHKRDSTGLMHDKYDRDPEEDSEGTVDLPDRFDEQGNRKPEDPLTEKINDLLSGKGGAGNIFKSLAEGFLGGEHGGGSHGGSAGGDSDDGGGRRRRSRR